MLDRKTIDGQFTEVHVAGPGAERTTECTICWAMVIDSSKEFHLEYHVKRHEFSTDGN
jgi:hypothetical protein